MTHCHNCGAKQHNQYPFPCPKCQGAMQAKYSEGKYICYDCNHEEFMYKSAREAKRNPLILSQR